MPQLSDFQGAWTLIRDITDFRDAQNARLTGRCDFFAQPEQSQASMSGQHPLQGASHATAQDTPQAPLTLVQHEVGELRVARAATALSAERKYLWQEQRGDAPAQIAVFFEDGRPFHSFDPALATPAASHDCPPDVYEVTYDLSAWPQWQATWRVRGPRKDYLSITHYAPL